MRQKTTKRLRVAPVMLVLLLCVGCRGFLRTSKMNEYIDRRFVSGTYQKLTVIAGGDGKSDVQITSRVREQMTENGVTLVKRSGLWPTEKHAVDDICAAPADAPERVDGVVFVRWNRLTLHDCATKTVMVEIDGGYSGTEKMTARMLQHLSPGEKKAAS